MVERNGVVILAPTNLPATVPVHASQLYSRNVTAFLNLLIKDGELHIDMNDNVVGPSCVTHQGQVGESESRCGDGSSGKVNAKRTGQRMAQKNRARIEEQIHGSRR